MEVVYRLGRASVADVLAKLSDPPSYSSVRAMLNFLEQKGLLRHEQDKRRYVYYPTVPRDEARHSALNDLLRTFFDGSPTQVMAALLDSSADRLSEHELDELAEMIEQARKQER
jgi:predicted transcriptional regulator